MKPGSLSRFSRLALLGVAAALLWLGPSGCGTTWQCNATTCATGCCDGAGVCILNGGQMRCGLGGSACGVCPNSCVSGTCACPAGQAWVEGRCTCTTASCADGCCRGDTCIAPWQQTWAQCGADGGVCTSCGGNAQCTAGRCEVCTLRSAECSAGGPPCCGAAQCVLDAVTGMSRCQ